MQRSTCTVIRINELITEKGTTQTEVAQAAGIDQPHLSKIASGRIRNPKIRTLQAIASALGVTVADLYGEAA